VDEERMLLTITGEQLGRWPGHVFLAGVSLDIEKWEPWIITAYLPYPYDPGTYLLAVLSGPSAERDFSLQFPVTCGEEGPQGPQGKVGPKGDKGDQGDQGDPGLSGYEMVRSAIDLCIPGSSCQLQATCPAGKTAVSGGYELIYVADASEHIYIKLNRRDTSDGGIWQVEVVNRSPGDKFNAWAWAYCAYVN